jgi:hypothetical protein
MGRSSSSGSFFNLSSLAFSAVIGEAPPAAATVSVAAALDCRGVGVVGVPLPAVSKHFVKLSLFGF